MELKLTTRQPSTCNLSVDSFSEQEKEQIMSIKSSINVADEEGILQLGSQVSREIGSLNKAVLSSVRVKDIPEIESILPDLNKAFKEVDSSSLLVKKTGFFSKIFKGDPIKDFIGKFENAETVVANIQSNLQRVEMELRKDVEIEDRLGQQNLQCIRELEQYIIAMRLKLDEEQTSLNIKKEQVDKDNFVALQLLAEEQDQLDALDKQIFWLEQQRILAIQTLPILRNLKNNNKDMIRQINMTVEQSIPAWEQGIIIAFHIHRQQGALRIERAIHEMTNQIVIQNSRLLKENSAEIARAVQSGMIDMETFREASKNIIETSQKLTEVKNEAIQNRQASIAEYRKITEELLEVEKRTVNRLGYAKVGGLNA